LDADLILRAQQGDPDAYEHIVRQHQEMVFRLAYLILGDAHDAEDTAQETFIRAYRHLHQFDPARPLRPWLLQITTNLARNRQRSVGRYLAALQRSLWMLPSETRTTENQHLHSSETQALYQAVQRLERIDQEVIYLRYILELSVQETAEVLQVEPGTVKSRLNRALKRLRGVVLRDFPLLVEGRRP
jgi:RNA polymerase sigma-70 factor (ECF subfamily)